MLDFELLGTAAGGGFPQWNCACALCAACRLDPVALPPRLHLQAMFSSGDGAQYLINASPDLKQQIENTPALRPSPSLGLRNTSIAGIVLTGADLDQVLGLLLLREFQPLTVYATGLVRRILEANPFFRMLQRVPNQLTWVEIAPRRVFALPNGVRCTGIPLSESLPHYARGLVDKGEGVSLGLLLEADGRRIAYMPSIPSVTEELLELFHTCDLLLADGTFFSDAELTQTHAGTPLARSIGHVPIGGQDGLVAQLAGLTRPLKVFVHINNTNPAIDPRSPQYTLIRQAGWEIAHDGWKWT